MLLSTPYFINKLGAESFGVWMLVNTVISSLGVLNVGFGDATIKFVAQYRANEDLLGVKNVIRATYSIYIVLCFVVILVSILIAILIKTNVIFNLRHEDQLLAYTILPIAGVTLGLKFIEQIFLAVFKGYNQYNTSAKISIAGKIIAMSVSVLVVYLGYSLITIFAGLLIVSFLFLLVEAYFVYLFFNFNEFVPYFDKHYVKVVFSFGLWSWLLTILGMLITQVDKYLVIIVADVKVFAFYSIAATLFNQMHSLFATSVSWVFPIVTGKINAKENIFLYYKKIQWLFLSTICVSLSLLYLTKNPFLKLWLDKDTYENTLPFIDLFICFNFIMASTILPYYFLNGSNHFRLNTLFNAITLVVRIFCVVFAYRFLGIEGLIFGLIVSALLVMPFQINAFYSKVFSQKTFLIGVLYILPPMLFLLLLKTNNILVSIAIVILVLAALSLVYSPKLNFLDHKANP